MSENITPWTPAVDILLPYVLGGMGIAIILLVAWVLIPQSDRGIADDIKSIENYLSRFR